MGGKNKMREEDLFAGEPTQGLVGGKVHLLRTCSSRSVRSHSWTKTQLWPKSRFFLPLIDKTRRKAARTCNLHAFPSFFILFVFTSSLFSTAELNIYIYIFRKWELLCSSALLLFFCVFVFAATFFELFHEVRLNSFIITFGKEAEQLLSVSLIQPFTLLLKLHLSVRKINNTER